MTSDFPKCPICATDDWRIAWQGRARAGAFGNLTAPTAVARCGGCGVERLAESACKDESFYAGAEYREFLGEGTDAEAFFAAHDPLQLERLQVVEPHRLRGKRIADIGCAGGSFLDHVRGVVAQAIAIDPAEPYHRSLAARGYDTARSVREALQRHRGTVDYVFCFSVIEHVDDPKAFLAEARELLADGGRLIVSTPNRGDILMSLLPADYPSFFYRAVHRWYFDAASLAECAGHTDLRVESLCAVHRFGLSNFTVWLRDRKPPGRDPIEVVDDVGLNAGWRAYLERTGRADYLYAELLR